MKRLVARLSALRALARICATKLWALLILDLTWLLAFWFGGVLLVSIGLRLIFGVGAGLMFAGLALMLTAAILKGGMTRAG